jgi:hypothetical protein
MKNLQSKNIHWKIEVISEIQGNMFQRLHDMFLESAVGLKIPHFEMELKQVVNSGRETYNRRIPLVK